MKANSTLPYQDTKPVGAADFYFAINATFRFVRKRLGEEALVRYWNDLGRIYYGPVSRLWRDKGLESVAQYWRDFFAAEPAAETQVRLDGDSVNLEVKTCPAIAHLRAHGREIDTGFCRHCYYVSEAIAAPAGLTVRVEGGNGSCHQRFFPIHPDNPPQDLQRIHSCS